MHTTARAFRIVLLAAATTAASAACTHRRVDPEPITVMRNGDRVGTSEGAVDAARESAARRQQDAMGARDSILAAALLGCAADICSAVTRGEVALGMTETQLLAATRTTPEAWSVRRSGDAAVYSAARADMAPRDVSAPVALVQVQGGRVASIAYHGAQGIRVVSRPADATSEARARGIAASLTREGDDLVAAGQLDLALARYDRASVLVPDDPTLNYRIATLLDKQLRPIEAIVRYQRFLHAMELERIAAYGDAYAKQAEAIAHAKERIVILEKRR